MNTHRQKALVILKIQENLQIINKLGEVKIYLKAKLKVLMSQGELFKLNRIKIILPIANFKNFLNHKMDKILYKLLSLRFIMISIPK